MRGTVTPATMNMARRLSKRKREVSAAGHDKECDWKAGERLQSDLRRSLQLRNCVQLFFSHYLRSVQPLQFYIYDMSILWTMC